MGVRGTGRLGLPLPFVAQWVRGESAVARTALRVLLQGLDRKNNQEGARPARLAPSPFERQLNNPISQSNVLILGGAVTRFFMQTVAKWATRMTEIKGHEFGSIGQKQLTGVLHMVNVRGSAIDCNIWRVNDENGVGQG